MSSTVLEIGSLVLLSVLMAACTSNPDPMFTPEQKSSFVDRYDRDGDGFITIAHRGASAYYPENTLIAFQNAVAMKADMMELDVTLSSDGIPVVIHDDSLERTTTGQGQVMAHTTEALRSMDAGSWFDPTFSDQYIPTLAEVLAAVRGKIAVNIEIKTEAVTDSLNGGIEEKCIRVVNELYMARDILFSSFDYRAVAHLSNLTQEIPVALLYEKKQSGNRTPAQLLKAYGASAFNCHWSQFSGRRRKHLVEHHIPTFIYTVNGRKRMSKMIRFGASGIFSDKPDLLLATYQNLASD